MLLWWWLTASFAGWVSQLAIVGISTRTILFPEFADGLLLVIIGRTSMNLFRRTGHLVVPDLHGGLLFVHALDKFCDHALELHEGALLWWQDHVPNLDCVPEAC